MRAGGWFLLVLFAGVCCTTAGAFAYDCPKPSQQLAEDTQQEVKSSASSLLGASKSDYNSRAATVTKDLFAGVPNADQVLVRQNLLSMYCQVLLSSNDMPTAEKLDRIWALDGWITHATGQSTPVRANDVANCPVSTDAVLKPIRNVFDAWTRLDVDLYLAQWAPDAIHRSPAGVLSIAQLAQHRRQDFGTYSRVEVRRFDPTITFVDGRKATVSNSYVMRFERPNGTSFVETEREAYTLECSPRDRTWRIRENDDYIPQWSR